MGKATFVIPEKLFMVKQPQIEMKMKMKTKMKTFEETAKRVNGIFLVENVIN